MYDVTVCTSAHVGHIYLKIWTTMQTKTSGFHNWALWNPQACSINVAYVYLSLSLGSLLSCLVYSFLDLPYFHATDTPPVIKFVLFSFFSDCWFLSWCSTHFDILENYILQLSLLLPNSCVTQLHKPWQHLHFFLFF